MTCHFIIQQKSCYQKRNKLHAKLYEPSATMQRKSTISNVKWSKAQEHIQLEQKCICKSVLRCWYYTHYIYCRLEWNWWSRMEFMILTMVNSESHLGQITYQQWYKICSRFRRLEWVLTGCSGYSRSHGIC